MRKKNDVYHDGITDGAKPYPSVKDSDDIDFLLGQIDKHGLFSSRLIKKQSKSKTSVSKKSDSINIGHRFPAKNNNCFINASLQVLFSIPFLNDIFSTFSDWDSLIPKPISEEKLKKEGKLSQQGIERLKLKYQISIFSVEVLKEVQAIFKDPKRSKTKLKKSLDVGKRFSKGRISWDAQDDTLIVLEQILECINNVFPEKGSSYSWTEKLIKENATLNVKDVTTEFSDTMHIRDIASNVFAGLQKRCQKRKMNH